MNVPDGWRTITLGQAGTWFGGGTPSKSRPDFWENGTVPWLSPKDMRGSRINRTRDKITEAAVHGSSVRLVPGGAVAFVVRSGILERALPSTLVSFATTLNQDMKAIVPHHDIMTPEWLALGFKAFEREILTGSRKAGTTVASLDSSKVKSFRLPLPPLPEQRRIVEMVEEHMAHLDAADASLAAAERRLDSLRGAALAQALRKAYEAPGTRTLRIGDLAAVGTGTTPKRSQASFYEGGTIPWVTSGDLNTDEVRAAKSFVTHEALEDTTLRLYPEGTLLLAMYGEGKTRGKVSRLRLAATINQACAAIQVLDDSLTPWMQLMLNAKYETLRRASAGGVQPNLNLAIVRSIELPIADVNTRQEALSYLTGLNDDIAQSRKALASARQRSTALRRAILAAAFSGRLTSAIVTDPADLLQGAPHDNS